LYDYPLCVFPLHATRRLRARLLRAGSHALMCRRISSPERPNRSHVKIMSSCVIATSFLPRLMIPHRVIAFTIDVCRRADVGHITSHRKVSLVENEGVSISPNRYTTVVRDDAAIMRDDAAIIPGCPADRSR
jgi:hypothetical protein